MAYVSFFSVCESRLHIAHLLIDWIFFLPHSRRSYFCWNLFSSSSSSLLFFFFCCSVFIIFFSLSFLVLFARVDWVWLCFFASRTCWLSVSVRVCVCASFYSLYILYASQNAASIIVLCHCILFLFLSLSHPLYNDLIGWLKLTPHSNEVSIWGGRAGGRVNTICVVTVIFFCCCCWFLFPFFHLQIC